MNAKEKMAKCLRTAFDYEVYESIKKSTLLSWDFRRVFDLGI